MSDISDAADLIATARDALLAELLPALPKERRYTGLMIANAMAIAVREERLGFDAARSEAARLRNLLDAVGASPMRAADPIDTELATLRACVRDAVRNGRFYCVRDEYLNTPAPSLLQGLKALAAAIHPSSFPQVYGLRCMRYLRKQV